MGTMLLVVAIAGIVGWVYEFLVALVETGDTYNGICVCVLGGNTSLCISTGILWRDRHCSGDENGE